MEQTETPLAQGLIVDTSLSSRRQLTVDLKSSGLVSELIEAQSVTHGLEILISKVLDICVIGPTLSEQIAVDFIKRAKPLVSGKDCAFVAVVGERSSASLEALLEAGADGALSQPYTDQTFTSIVKEAIQVSKSVRYTRRAPREEELQKLTSAASHGSLPSALLATAQGLRIVAKEITRGKLKLTEDGEPTLVAKEAIRHALERALCVDTYEAKIPGTFDHFFVGAVIEWFNNRVHQNEKICSERLRKRLLRFKH